MSVLETVNFATGKAFQEPFNSPYVPVRERVTSSASKPIGVIIQGPSGLMTALVHLKGGKIRIDEPRWFEPNTPAAQLTNSEAFTEFAVRCTSRLVIVGIANSVTFSAIKNTKKLPEDEWQRISSTTPSELFGSTTDPKKRHRCFPHPSKECGLLASVDNELIVKMEKKLSDSGLKVQRSASTVHAIINVVYQDPRLKQKGYALLLADQGNLYFFAEDWMNRFRHTAAICPLKNPAPTSPPPKVTEFLNEIKIQNGDTPILFVDTLSSHLPLEWLKGVGLPIETYSWPAAVHMPTAFCLVLPDPTNRQVGKDGTVQKLVLPDFSSLGRERRAYPKQYRVISYVLYIVLVLLAITQAFFYYDAQQQADLLAQAKHEQQAAEAEKTQQENLIAKLQKMQLDALAFNDWLLLHPSLQPFLVDFIEHVPEKTSLVDLKITKDPINPYHKFEFTASASPETMAFIADLPKLLVSQNWDPIGFHMNQTGKSLISVDMTIKPDGIKNLSTRQLETVPGSSTLNTPANPQPHSNFRSQPDPVETQMPTR